MAASPLFLLLIYLFPILLIAAAIYGITKYLKNLKKPNRIRPKPLYTIPSAVCVIVAAVSWIMNMGWLRVFLTWIPIPLIYSIFFIIASRRAARFITLNDADKKMRSLMISSHITYLLSFLFFPDFGDTGSPYVFFGLIHNNHNKIVSLFIELSIPLFIATIIIMIVIFCNTKLPNNPHEENKTNEISENTEDIN